MNGSGRVHLALGLEETIWMSSDNMDKDLTSHSSHCLRQSLWRLVDTHRGWYDGEMNVVVCVHK